MIVDAYLSRDHFDDRDGSCPMIALPSDVSRGGESVKGAFRQVLEMMVDAFAANLGPRRRSAARAGARRSPRWWSAAWCSPAPSTIRCSPTSSATAARTQALAMAGWDRAE